MMKQLALLAALVLLFGCLAQPYSTGQQGAQQPAASGTQAPPQGAQNQSSAPPSNGTQETVTPPPANTTPVQQNQTPPTPPPGQEQQQQAPAPQQTTMSVGDILNQKVNSFPNPSGGPFYTQTFQWVSKEFESNASDITLNPTLNVEFDNKVEKNLVGFAFTTYQPSSGSGYTTANGVAIIYNGSLYLDGRLASGIDIEIEYNVDPPYNRTLKGVTLLDKQVLINSMNRTVAVYTFDADNVK